MRHSFHPKDFKKAFTLIELSIVLVIIGLVIGGVLVGKDLIKAAEIRWAISQIDRYNSAALAFKLKYNGLPGDLANAAQFGFPQAGGVADGWGPRSTIGDAQINSCRDDMRSVTSDPPGFISFGCENAMFWTQLSMANLITEQITNSSNATTWVALWGVSVTYTNYVPASRFKDNYVLINYWNGFNYFLINGVGGRLSNSSGQIVATNTLSPYNAFLVDQKIDDSSPIKGNVLANDYSAADSNYRVVLSAGSPTSCRNVSDQYNINSNVEFNPLCQLRIRAAF